MGVSVREEVGKQLRTAGDILSEEVARSLMRLGEEGVRITRERPQEESWFDRTGNLRQSIGYIVLRGGQEVASTGNRPSGLAPDPHKGDIDLTLFAGMNYASFVEAIAGKDVLASTETWARANAGQRIENGVKKALQRIMKL